MKMSCKSNSHSLSVRRGLTLTEVLVATVIISVSLIGMVSSWLYMIHSAVSTDERAGGYICARSVLERAKINGFFPVQPPTFSAPMANNSRSVWVMPNLFETRYFNASLDELPQFNRVRPIFLDARYKVVTEITYSPDGTYPAGREDLRMMTVTVTAYQFKTGEQLAKLHSCMAQGGL